MNKKYKIVLPNEIKPEDVEHVAAILRGKLHEIPINSIMTCVIPGYTLLFTDTRTIQIKSKFVQETNERENDKNIPGRFRQRPDR